MAPEKNGRAVELLASGKPYQVWEGDEWLCPACRRSVVIGFGLRPVAEHFQGRYERARKGALEVRT